MNKRKSLERSSIAQKVIAKLTNAHKQRVINIDDVKRARTRADELATTIASIKELSLLDPLHAVYVYGQNKMSIFVEQLAELPELSKLTTAYCEAEDEYMPSGPPMSPLTSSYFSCWGCFDLYVGVRKETFATIAIEICKALDINEGLIRIFEKMQSSRMGVYIHDGFSNEHILLRELVSGKKLNVVVPSGHKGQPGEIWLARVMPEPVEELHFGYSVVFTTPYIIGKVVDDYFYQVGDEREWRHFFKRTLGKTKEADSIAGYERLMKFGLNRHYWNEYIFESFFNYTPEAILLTGFPDIPLSRPHSKESILNRER